MEKLNHFKKWTAAEIDFLKNSYEDLTRQEIADELGRTFSSIKSKAKELDLKKSKQAISKISKRQNTGQFKPGQTPTNHKPIGYIKECLDKRTGNVYLYIKYKDEKGIHSVENFKPLSYYNWEKVNGPIPKGMFLAFKDGNTRNCAVENLELISMPENMYRNSKHNYPKEIIPSLVLLNKINNKLKSIENGKK